MSLARPAGSRLAFFAILPIALLGMAVNTFPLPAPGATANLTTVLALDGVFALGLLALWPYHRMWAIHQLLGAMVVPYLLWIDGWMLVTGILELPSGEGFRKLLLLSGPGTITYLLVYFVWHGRSPWSPPEPWGLDDPLLVEAPVRARATWSRFLQRLPEAQLARVQVRLPEPGFELELGVLATLVLDASDPLHVELKERESEAQEPEGGENDDWDVVAFTLWGRVVGADEGGVRVLAEFPGIPELPDEVACLLPQICDWEVELPDGSIEGAHTLRARGVLARQHGIRLPREARRRLRRCRSLPDPAS